MRTRCLRLLAFALVTLGMAVPLFAEDYPAPELKRKMPDTVAIAGNVLRFTVETKYPPTDPVIGTIYEFRSLEGPTSFSFPSMINSAFWDVPDTAKSDTVIYEVKDLKGRRALDTFFIRIDHPPVLTTPMPVETLAVVGKKFTLQVKATDPDGDKVSYELAAKVGDMAVSKTGEFTYTPVVADTGITRVNIFVRDSLGAETRASVDLIVSAAGSAVRDPRVVRGDGALASAASRSEVFDVRGRCVARSQHQLRANRGSAARAVLLVSSGARPAASMARLTIR